MVCCMTDDIRVNTSRRSENNIGPRHRNSVTQQLVNSGASNLQISNVSYFINNLFYELSNRQRKFKSFKQILFRMKDSWKIQYSFRFIVRMGAQEIVSHLLRISLFAKFWISSGKNTWICSDIIASINLSFID